MGLLDKMNATEFAEYEAQSRAYDLENMTDEEQKALKNQQSRLQEIRMLLKKKAEENIVKYGVPYNPNKRRN